MILAKKGIASVTPLYYCSSSNTAPAKPTSHVTTDNVGIYNAWNIKCANYTTTYKYYYTCSEIKYTDNTYAWSDVVADQSVMFVNNFQVGGRNYYLTSDTFTSAGSGATGITPSIDNGDWKIVVASDNGNWHSWAHSNIIEENFETGDTFAFSFDIKSDDAVSTTPPKIYFKNGMGYYATVGSVSSEWSRVYYTGTWNDNNTISTHFGWSGLEGTYYIRKIKFERGNKATDWTLAPEDIQNDIDNLTTALPNYITNEEYDQKWLVKKGEIEGYAESTFTTQTEFGSFEQYARGQFALIPDGVRIEAIATSTFNNNITGIQETVNDVKDTFDFTTNGLIIKKTGNTLYLQLENDELAFRTDNTELGKKAYMTSSSFVLKELTTFQLGNYAFVVKDNGSVDFKKIG